MPYTKDHSTIVNNWYTTTNYHKVNGAFSTSRPSLQCKLQRTLTGDKNPSWRTQVENHQNATTVMSARADIIESVKPGFGRKRVTGWDAQDYFEYTYTGRPSSHRYLPYPTPTDPSMDPASARNQAMTKAFKQVRKVQQSMSGLVFLGELQEAIHMLRHPAEGLRKALKSDYLDKLQKVKKAKPDKWKKAISQSWLEGCFGWRPFLNDLEDAAEAYNQARERLTDQFKSIRAIGKDQKFISTLFEQWAPVADFYVKSNRRIWEEAIVVIRGEVKSQAVTTALDKAKIFGLSPGEFAPTAWELLPWSFLVDYFTNIGDIIEAGATNTAGIAWLEMATIRKRFIEASTTPDVQKNRELQGANLLVCDGRPDYVKWHRRLVARNQLSSLSVPSLSWELPGSPIKQLNMLALWTQANSISSQDIGKLRGRSFR